jgi:hypothetical protein
MLALAVRRGDHGKHFPAFYEWRVLGDGGLLYKDAKRFEKKNAENCMRTRK